MLVAVCGDCRENRQEVCGLLRKYKEKKKCGIEIAEYSCGTALCEDQDTLSRCGILFLGVNEGKGDGLQTARRVKTLYPDIHVVLVAASIGCALEGYKVKASRCLVRARLSETFEECMDDILREIKLAQRRFLFPFVEGEMMLPAARIVYVETEGHKNVFHTVDAVYSLYRKLDVIEEELRSAGFVRIHRSFLVNMGYIERLSGYVLQLSTGQKLSVPKTRYAQVKREYALYKGL